MAVYTENKYILGRICNEDKIYSTRYGRTCITKVNCPMDITWAGVGMGTLKYNGKIPTIQHQ
jgi:hypothetical protein